MEDKHKILHELKEISPLLAQHENTNPYNVSSFYFDELAEQILTQIRTATAPAFSLAKKMPFTTPVNYFENLSNSILEKIEREEHKSAVFEEMEEISPLLNTISKDTIYTVPQQYFDKIASNTSADLVKSSAKPLTVVRRMVSYAAAAIITALFAVGIFMFTGKDDETVQNKHIQSFSEVEKLSEQEIVNFLKTTSGSNNIVSSKNSPAKKDSDIKSIVSQMSDKEIQRFLEEYGEQDGM
jgi:hypothetical protein